MKKNSTAATADPAEQSIEQLTERYQTLNTRRIEAGRDLEHATDRLESLRKEARERFSTDDIGQLREKLRQMTEANELARRKYQAELDKIESDLAEVEEQFANSNAAPNSEDDSL
jgi:septation ring formation regulator EzrA